MQRHRAKSTMGSYFFGIRLLFLTALIIIVRGELSLKHCIAPPNSVCHPLTTTRGNAVEDKDPVVSYDPNRTSSIFVICESDEPARVLLNNPIEDENGSRESWLTNVTESKYRYFYQLRLKPKDGVVYCESYSNPSTNDHLSLVEGKTGVPRNSYPVVVNRRNPDNKMDLTLKLHSSISCDGETVSYRLSCLFKNPQNGTAVDLQVDEHKCGSVFQCDSRVQLKNGTVGLVDEDYMKKQQPGGAVLADPQNGVVFCSGYRDSLSERVEKLDYIFKGIDKKRHLASQVPKHAVIVIKEESTTVNRTFVCTGSSFILFPPLRFLLRSENGGEEILSPGGNSTWWYMSKGENHKNIMDQKIHFSQLPHNATTITCFAMLRNSSEKFMADDFAIPSGYMTAGQIWEIVGFAIASLFALAGIHFAVVYLRFQWMHRNLFQHEEDKFLREFPERLHLHPESLEKSSIENQENILGQGQYGTVIRGKFRGQTVAVKVPIVEEDTPTFKQVVLRELTILAHIDTHKHVVLLHGAVVNEIRNRKCDAVFEYSPYGDLEKFLRTELAAVLLARAEPAVDGYTPARSWGSQEHDDDLSINWLRYLISFCFQIASGMEYLIYKNVVHCDLAARNVLLFENYTVKITDFGLAGLIDEELGIYKRIEKTRIPWTHMPPESLKHGTFCEASDVWAFGVTVWEIFSLGDKPYSEYKDDFKTFYDDLVHNDMRLPKPHRMPVQVYDLLSICWTNVYKSPQQRPTFPEAKEIFEKLLEDEKQGRLVSTDGNRGTNDIAGSCSNAIAGSCRPAPRANERRQAQDQVFIELSTMKEDIRPLLKQQH